MNHSFIFVTIAILFSFVFIAPTVRAETSDGPQHKFFKGANAHDEGAKVVPEKLHKNPDDLCKRSSCRISTDTPGFKDKFFRGHKEQQPDSGPARTTTTTTTTNGTTTTANVTIPVCDGVVGGPCLDPNMHTIIP